MSKEIYIYESPDKGKTVFRRKFGEIKRELVEDFNDDSKNRDQDGK